MTRMIANEAGMFLALLINLFSDSFGFQGRYMRHNIKLTVEINQLNK